MTVAAWAGAVQYQNALPKTKTNKMEKKNSEDAKVLADELLFLTQTEAENFVDVHAKNVIYYIAGYAARAIARRLPLDCCQCLLIQKKGIPSIVFESCYDSATPEGTKDEYDLDDIRKTFIKKMDRGGLCYPTEVLYLVSLHSWHFFTDVMKEEDTRLLLLSSSSPKAGFTEAVLKLLKRSCR